MDRLDATVNAVIYHARLKLLVKTVTRLKTAKNFKVALNFIFEYLLTLTQKTLSNKVMLEENLSS